MAFQQACTLTFFCVSSLLVAMWSSPFVLCVLVSSPSLNLQYHKGPLLAAGDGPLKLHLTFYGDFTSLEKDTIKSFLHSLREDTSPSHIAQFSPHKNAPLKSTRKLSAPELKKPLRASSEGDSGVPSSTVAQWWSLTQAYTDVRGNGISQTVLVEHEISDDYSHGKLLSHSALASLAMSSARQSAAARRANSHAVEDNSNIHLLFTAADVAVEGFCMHACGRHSHTHSDGDLGKVVYAWVGNARDQCPGYCAWPFVRTEYGPDMEPLKAPNLSSADGMIVNLAKVLVEAATNPFGDGYYLGVGSHGVGAGSVCTGIYGDNAFPGYPGRTLQDPVTGASFNVKGHNQSKFLVPYIWNPLTFSCAGQP